MTTLIDNILFYFIFDSHYSVEWWGSIIERSETLSRLI